MSLSTHKIPAFLSNRKILFAVGALVLAVGLFAWFRPKKSDATESFFTARKNDLLISIVEGGTLQAVNEVVIRNEVEGTARIIFIVPEGSYVKKGDLLVELDSASAQDQVNQQLISVEKAQFALIQAEEQLEIQKSVVDSEIRAAELKLKFAKLDLQKYLEGEATQEIRKAQNEITTIQEKLAIDREKADWSEKLEKQGFETKSNRDRDLLTVTQSKLSYEMATNALWMLQQFDLPKKRQTFESAVNEAEDELKRVKHQGTRKLAQYEADVKTQTITLELSQNKLKRDQRNLAAAKIYAPQDGLVVYSVSDNRFSSESLIEEGATVRNRQTFIKLPDISEMKLSIKIHESHINMVSPGQLAYIVLDSMPEQRFRGHVSKVGILPDTQSRWGNPNLKVYATEILVTDKLPDVKPGVSARAEVIVTNLQNVIAVPLQAVTTRQGKQVVYIADGSDTKPVNVQVGLYNTKMIEIVSGLNEGDQVLLSPPFDTEQKDLAGAIVSEGENVGVTNVPVIPGPAERQQRPERPRPQNGPERAPSETLLDSVDQPRLQQEGSGAGNSRGNRQTSSGGRPNFEELRKQFDKNGDGQLDDEERQAMRAAMPNRGGQGGGGGGRRNRESGGGEQSQQGGGRGGSQASSGE